MKQQLLTIWVNIRYRVIFACLYWESQGNFREFRVVWKVVTLKVESTAIHLSSDGTDRHCCWWHCLQKPVPSPAAAPQPASQPPPIAAKPQMAPKPQVAAKPQKPRPDEATERPADVAAAPAQLVSAYLCFFCLSIYFWPYWTASVCNA